MIREHPSAESVRLYSFTAEVVQTLFTDNDRVKSLHLQPPRSAGIIAAIFDHVKGLQRLEFSGECAFTVAAAQTIARNNPDLTSLDISTKYSVPEMLFLATVLDGCPKLRWLTFENRPDYHNSTTNMGQIVGAALMKAYPQLQHVRVETRA